MCRLLHVLIALPLLAGALSAAAQNGSRAHPGPAVPIELAPAPQRSAPVIVPSVSSLAESFNDITTLVPAGWFMQNNSAPQGIISWFQGNAVASGGPFDAHSGAANAYIGVNFNSTAGGTGTISNWLVTPVLDFGQGGSLSFYTRTVGVGTIYPDRLEVRLSRNGASTNVGSGATAVGDFTTLLLSVNPNLTTSGYPFTWTNYVVSNLPRNGSGRIAFRYFVTGAGPSGVNSDYIGIDTVAYEAGPPLFAVGGTVTGLAGSGLSLTLNGGPPQAVNSGSFEFPTYLFDGASYVVAVSQQPGTPNQTCTVQNGTGLIANADVGGVQIDCVTHAYEIAGTVTGLAGSGLVLRNNDGDDLPIASDGPFAFATPLPDLSAYAVAVHQQPSAPNQICTVADGAGQLAGGPVGNVQVSCVTLSYTVGGTVSGLLGSGLVLRNNGGDDLPIAADGPYTFPTALLDGSAYAVTVHSQPSNPPQTCQADNGSGSLAGGPVGNVDLVCVVEQRSVTASVVAGSGEVSPAQQTVFYGDDATVAVTPTAGWFTLSVTGDDCQPQDNGDGSWTAAAVASDCAIEVRFAPTHVTVSASVVEGEGSITPANQMPEYGGDAQLAVAPDLAWSVASIDGDTCTPVDNGDGTWTASGVEADCAVEARFAAATPVVAGGSGQWAAVGTAFAAPLIVRVTDAGGEPWPGLTIIFQAPASGASATLSAGSAVTNAHGIVSVLAMANLEEGEYSITAHIDGAVGIAPIAFAMNNGTASFELSASIDDGRSFARYGQLLDYLVRVGNAGPHPANGVDVVTSLSAGLDESFAHWLCLDAGGSGCTAQGTGGIAESGVRIPAGGTVTWLLSVPVRVDASEDQVLAELDVAAPSQAPQASDENTLVLFRNGFNAPYEDGASSLAWLDVTVPEDVVDGDAEAGAAVREVLLPPVRGEGIATVWRATLPDDGTVEVQRLVYDERAFLRLVVRGAAGVRLSAWAPYGGESSLWIAFHAGGERSAFALDVDGVLLEVRLD